ncbi:cytochrome c biogenesis CcdA family protein [Paenibacillus sp.]|uniref:cytochrome c biogenesis CcdA family protein n=1 Tax=Paenibacillus sp. TaxID=58172 RepID=UPI002D330B99|nr:cytochrome c biogenesis protein CcdA [Paenibacillus sp.]HZG58080.1 cytochrome c biogenesis protein CcdA [Paenibacillus sp.]
MDVTIWIAFAAGLASFISPCCLPLYPSYLSYISGISVSQIRTERTKEVRFRTLSHTFFFILGFSVVYYAFGAGAGLVAELFRSYQDLIAKLSAVLLILVGLFLLGIFQPQFLMRDMKLKVGGKPATYAGSFLIGIGFAAGWSPCIGPIFSAIIGLSTTEPGIWFRLTTAYTLGFAVPFFAMAFFLGSTKWILRYSNAIMKVGGSLLIVFGILLYTGQMLRITVWFNAITPEWLKF